MNDSDLLRQYVQGSQTAFAELLKRHVNLVYGAALRQVRDPGLAEDITQQVFIALSRKAPRLLGHKVLAAWLFDVTRFTALDALKTRARRLRHEREAAQMAAQKSQPNANSSEWGQIDSILDQAMSRLSGVDRAILLLRYWQDQSTGELAEALGISDDTARKRLSRATDRLRKLLARDGATVSAGALGPLLSTNVLAQAPIHLTAKVLSGAAAKSVAPGSAATAKGTGILVATLKAKSVAVAIIAFAALGGTLYVGNRYIMSNDATTGAAASTADSETTMPVPPVDLNWQTRFNSVYSLAPGEVLKQISPPYIRERATYFEVYEKQFGTTLKYSADSWFMFSWKDSLHWEQWSNGQGSAGAALTTGLTVRAYQVEGPVNLWKTPFPGDLICRTSATPDERMKAFATILSTSLGRKIHFEKAHTTRNAIVLRGTFVPPKRPDGKDATIQVTPGPLKGIDSSTVVTGGTNIDTYCEDLERQTRMQVINQLKTRYRGGMSMTTELTPPDISRHPDQLQSLLNNLSSQTGLQYTLEPREINLWTWTEG